MGALRVLNTLSGRFLLLTVGFVMLAEVFIFVPSVSRFREDYLLSGLERAQIAALAVLASQDMIEPELEQELLDTAGVFNVVLRRDQSRQLVLSSPIPEPVHRTFDLRQSNALTLMRDAVLRLVDPRDRVIRVVGEPVQQAGQLIEVTMAAGPLRKAMIEYGLRILALSAVISAIAGGMLFLAVRRILVTPIRRVVRAMQSYAESPEDNRRIIVPNASVRELREAENALQKMETRLTTALRQKDRLAQLGSAVAKISHDLRNILTTAQLFADRMDRSDDPSVRRAAPKIVRAISRAVNLCETTLAFGKAEEPPPALSRVSLASITQDVMDSERMAAGEHDISFAEDVPAGMVLRADPEQLFRVLSNLIRNARQAIEASGKTGEIAIQAREDEVAWSIRVTDTGPGLPPKAREHLFTAFQGGVRKGGHGLGLAISAELIRGHGGRLELHHTGEDGTTFNICLPRDREAMETAAE